MDGVSVIIGAVGSLLVGVLGVLFTKGRLGDVLASRSDQEKSAVETMGDLLTKAIDGWVAMSEQMRELGVSVVSLREDVRGNTAEVLPLLRNIEVVLANIGVTAEDIASVQEEMMRIITEGK